MSEYFFGTPVEFQKLLTEKGLINEIYKCLENNDSGDAVMNALKILNKTKKMPIITKVPEVSEASQFFRQLADQCVDEQDYRNAFELYNQAIRCAPNDSNAMLEAYFGRSKLLIKTGTCWLACIADIDKCFEWDNPVYQPKLKQMKALCKKKLKATRTSPDSPFIDGFFKLVDKHPKVPGVSAAVDFIVENGRPKVVAGKYIPIGTLVALETAYVVHMDEEYGARACHFCQALSLNLVPCDSCRYILFCSQKCKKLCWEEYHNVECHIIHLLYVLNAQSVVYQLAVKAAIKLKNLCTWEEFNALSIDLGLKQGKGDLINEIFDVNNKVSILRCNNDKNFIIGQTYNVVFVVATIVHYLKSVPSFFPTDPQKKENAIQALSKVLVHLSLKFGSITKIPTVSKNNTSEDISLLQIRNYGLFSFTSKLKHACDPNLYVVGLNNKVALLTLKPIKRGEELTISIIGHWREVICKNRSLEMFTWAETICRCQICVEKWDPLNSPKAKNMTEQQKQVYGKWNHIRCAYNLGMAGAHVMYKETCYCLNALQNLPNTAEYKELFTELRHILLFLQYEFTKNCTYLDSFKNSYLSLK